MVNPNERKINPLTLLVHGISVAIQSNNKQWLKQLAHDFAFFSVGASASAELELNITFGEPAWQTLPDQAASQVYSECVVYEKKDGSRFIDYHGKALLHDTGRAGHLQTTDADLAHELAFLYVLSKVGTRLDKQGLHRVHALGFAKGGNATIVLIPSGGGKSTLASAVLQMASEHGVTLLSDDTPLVDRNGNALPFPLRLAYRTDFPLPETWEKSAETLRRRKYGEKKLIPLSALPAKTRPTLADRFPVCTIVLAERHGSRTTPRMIRASKQQVLSALNRDLVVGLGLPQVAELVLRKGLLSLLRLAPTGASRLFAATRLAGKARGYRLQMCDNPLENAKAMMEVVT